MAHKVGKVGRECFGGEKCEKNESRRRMEQNVQGIPIHLSKSEEKRSWI